MDDRYTLKLEPSTSPQQRRALAAELAGAFQLNPAEAEALLAAETLVLTRSEAQTLVARCHDLGIRVMLVNRPDGVAGASSPFRRIGLALTGLVLVAALLITLALIVPATPAEPELAATPATDSAAGPAASIAPVLPALPSEAEDLDLFTAARDAGPEDVREALARSPNVDARDAYGQTPLMYAAGANGVEVVQALVLAGAQVNARSDADWTALMYAARNSRYPEVTSYLLEAGAEPQLRNDSEHTARDIALAYNNTVAAEQLAAAESALASSVHEEAQAGALPLAAEPQAATTTASPPAAEVTRTGPIVSRPRSEVPPEDPNRDVLERCLADWDACGQDP